MPAPAPARAGGNDEAFLTLATLRRLLAGELGEAVPQSRTEAFAQQFAREFEGHNAPAPAPEPTPAAPAAAIAPSAFTGGSPGPSVAIATYDSKTGQFATPDGNVARQTSVVARDGGQNWTDLMPTG